EGFGLPVLEAMRSGVPVLTTNRSSLPEVAGDAALLIDPEDVDAMTTSLERLLTDS
ncbi:MAG TPA: glycosyltransferase family 1 protein, partial [Gammaproteobacteria bacterium]|nr:glycosyltransferase family 1 protein [Gammaproteobacteria bacterium]